MDSFSVDLCFGFIKRVDDYLPMVVGQSGLIAEEIY